VAAADRAQHLLGWLRENRPAELAPPTIWKTAGPHGPSPRPSQRRTAAVAAAGDERAE
jgi:hypothetical protein